MAKKRYEPKSPISDNFFIPNHSGVRKDSRISNLPHAYGGFQDKSEELTIALQNTWYKLTNAAHDLFSGDESFAIGFEDDEITMEDSGDYFGVVSMTLTGDNAVDYQLRVYNITQSKVMGYKIGVTTKGAGNFSNITLPLYFDSINKGDRLRMEIQNISNAKNPTFKNSVFYISYLHE